MLVHHELVGGGYWYTINLGGVLLVHHELVGGGYWYTMHLYALMLVHRKFVGDLLVHHEFSEPLKSV